MKISVIYNRSYGKEIFYPADQWTKDLLHVFRGAALSFSRRQIEELKKLGFEIEAVSEKIDI